MPSHPYPPDTRVHHAGDSTPGAYERGTATVLTAAPQNDGSFLYRVRRDSGGEASWVSYFTIPVEADAVGANGYGSDRGAYI